MTETDGSRDYIDIFCAFALQVIPDNTFVDTEHIRREMIREFHFHEGIPDESLRTILKRGKHYGYLEIESRKETDRAGKQQVIKVYQLSPAGLAYLESLDSKDSIKKRIEDLQKDVCLYWRNKGTILEKQEIEKSLIYFVSSNINMLGSIVKGKKPINDFVVSGSCKDEKYIIEYLGFAKENAMDHYRTFSEMVHGSIISVALYSDRVDEIGKEKIKPCNVYIDTNFAFSILNMHVKEECRSARYLLGLLYRYKFPVRIFDFTVDEMRIVLNRFSLFLTEQHRYPPEQIHKTRFGLYQTIQEQGWTVTRVREFSNNLEKILKEMNIRIEYISSAAKKAYLSDAETHYSRFESYVPNRSERSRKHDLLAIEVIKKKRNHRVMKLEESKAFFLSSDIALSRFSYDVLGHRDEGSICEVILDRLLLNMLWLKNPRLDPPLETIISLHSRHLFLNKNVWDRFYEILKKLLREHNITGGDITQLFYDNYIGRVLGEIEEDKVDIVTEDFIKEHIGIANENVRKDEQTRKKYEEERMKLEEELINLKEELEQEKDDIRNLVLGLIDRQGLQQNFLRRKARVIASKRAEKLIRCIWILFDIFYLGGLWLFYNTPQKLGAK